MSNTTQMATRPPRELEMTVREWLSYAAAAMPMDIAEEKLVRAGNRLKVAILASADPEKLMSCSGESIGKCVALSAMTQLYPGPGEMKPDVWLIPRDVREQGKVVRTDLNWQMGAAAFKRLARRAGFRLEPTLVFEGEGFDLVLGTDPQIAHRVNLDVEKSWGTLRLGYIIVRDLATGTVQVDWLNKDQINQRRRKAQTDKVWAEWPLEMALKTLCSYAGNREMFPLDEVTRAALAADNFAETGGLDAPEIARREMAAEVHENANLTPIALPPRQEEPPPKATAGPGLSAGQIDNLKAVADQRGVEWSDVEQEWAGPGALAAQGTEKAVLADIEKLAGNQPKGETGTLPGVGR